MSEEKIYVSFACQRCLQPVKLDESLNSFGEHLLAELTVPINSTPDVDLESQTTSYDHYVHPCGLSDSGNGVNDFTLITNTDHVDNLSNQLKIHATLFDTLSGFSEIDHPLCDECTEALIELLDQELKLADRDYNDYCTYLKKLQNESNEPSLSELEKELEDLKGEEKRLLSELEALKQEEVDTLKAIEKEEEEAARLDKEEDRYWKEYTRQRRDYMQTDDESKSLENQLNYAKNQVDKLKKTNAFNATFHIWHQGHFGTINNFRLGRLPSAPVDWSEINAAWGQAALLLSGMARKINLTFDNYKLVPYGNHSHIEVISEQKELPLYGSGGFRYFWDAKFDLGMVAFMDCLRQFTDRALEDDQFNIPYRMIKGKIGEAAETMYSVKIQFNSEEQWTKALKFMLTNMKWGLAWVTSKFSNDFEDTSTSQPRE